MNAPDELPYTLTFDEEHGAYDPRWYCRICGASGVDERAHGDEDSAMTAALVQEEPIAMRLTTAPGVGPVTASAFVATIDDMTRFHSAHELEAYLGVIPSERSSGWLLVEAAWQILRSKSPQTLARRNRGGPGANRVD